MNSKELKNIIDRIQVKDGLKVASIANTAKVNRSYLSTLINSNEVKEVEPAFIGKLAKAFPEYFDQQKPTTASGGGKKLDEIITSLNEIREYAITLITGQTAGHEVIMGALDRLEKNPEGSLSEAADRLALKIAERLHVIQTGRHANEGKQG